MADTTTSRTALDYRPDIDGLRAFAVAIVALFHIFPGRLEGCFVRVDVFSVISGYLRPQPIGIGLRLFKGHL